MSDVKMRVARIQKLLDEFALSEWLDADGIPHEPQRFAMVDDTGSYAWLQFGDTVEYFDDFFSEGFEPVLVLDLDTGERYEPVLRWRKSSAATHAIGCDMDEDCSCGAKR